MQEVLNKEERTWGLFAHFSAFAGFFIPFGNILGPLVVWLIKKDESAFVNDQGKEALNFQISITIYLAISAFLIVLLIGIPLLVLLFFLDLILVIVAGIKANDGIRYRYPMNMRIVR